MQVWAPLEGNVLFPVCLSANVSWMWQDSSEVLMCPDWQKRYGEESRSEKETIMRLGQLIRAWRESRHLTIKLMAKEIGISANSLGQFEKGTKDPSWNTFLAIWEWTIAGTGAREEKGMAPTTRLLARNPAPDAATAFALETARQYGVAATLSPLESLMEDAGVLDPVEDNKNRGVRGGKQVLIPETSTPAVDAWIKAGGLAALTPEVGATIENAFQQSEELVVTEEAGRRYGNLVGHPPDAKRT